MNTERSEFNFNETLGNLSKEEAKSIRVDQITCSWEDSVECNRQIFNTFGSSLMIYDPVFLYRNTNANSDLVQLVVVKRNTDDFGVSISTVDKTVVYPGSLTKNYLEEEIVELMKRYRVDNSIIETYKQIIIRL